MRKKTLFGDLLPHVQNYRQTHPRTADLDIAVVRKFAAGKNAVQIAMEIPCAEATVYRAVKRIDQYLAQMEPTGQWQCVSFQEKKKS